MSDKRGVSRDLATQLEQTIRETPGRLEGKTSANDDAALASIAPTLERGAA